MLPVVRVNHGQGVQTVMGLVWVTPLDLVQVPCLHDGCWRKDRYLLACRCAQRCTPLPELVIFYWRHCRLVGVGKGGVCPCCSGPMSAWAALGLDEIGVCPD